MRIAQVSPLYESVPPRYYGGTERVVFYLTEELVRTGHNVTLFASGDSLTSAELRPMTPRSLRLDPNVKDPLAHHLVMMDHVFNAFEEFDIIHFHTDYLHFPFKRNCPVPTLTTLHGRLDIPDIVPVYRRFMSEPLVSISNSQREPLHFANWAGTVYHGLPHDLYACNNAPQGYLAFVGRISPEKRPDRAIEIAKKARIPLKIAAKIDEKTPEYFDQVVAPHLKEGVVEFIGEIGEDAKNDFLGNARALLFPIDWPEPFGMVMIEALACGTPVVAYRNGSVPEVIEHGVTGYIVNDVAEAVQAVRQISNLNRLTCRQAFEKNFSAGRMAADYLNIYNGLLRREMASQVHEDFLAQQGAAHFSLPLPSKPNLASIMGAKVKQIEAIP